MGSFVWCLLGLALATVSALDNGLGLTPQMGYSSWMDTSSNITESRIKYIADSLVSSGLSKLGYVYVNVDEGWLKTRDSKGNMVSDPVKFPSGMKALGDYIHSKGLKYGLYTCRGSCQCSTSQYQGPGSLGHEKQDAEIMVSWGMDYLKEDSCCGDQNHTVAFEQYGLMRDALNATGRHVFFSLCGWNDWYAPVGYSLGNSWRIAGDGDNWPALTNCINVMNRVNQYAKPGGWNDPDLLIGTGVGSYGPDRGGWYQTDLQSRSQFSMWCLFPSPLLISADFMKVSAYGLKTWSNKNAIAINQDAGRHPEFPHGAFRIEGTDLGAHSGTNVWGRALANGDFGVVFLNNNPQSTNVVCNAACFAAMKFVSSATLRVFDIWANEYFAHTLKSPFTFNATVAGDGGCNFYRISAA